MGALALGYVLRIRVVRIKFCLRHFVTWCVFSFYHNGDGLLTWMEQDNGND